jgi:hypothetical protein
VGQPPDHGVTSSAFAAAPSAPLIWFHHAAREDRTIRFKSLSGHAQTEAVESSEGGQVRAAEAGRRGSVGHVEVFRMDGFDAAASSGETVGTGRSSSVTTGWRRPPRSAFAQVSGSFAQWAHQAIDAKPT